MQDTPRPNGLPPDEIIRRVKKALAKAGETHTWEDVVELLKAGHAQAFWNEHGIWITEIMQSPRKRWLHVWIVAGALPHVMDLQPAVIAFAKEKGAERITATARFGWKHVAEAHGWHRKAMVITHEV
jgi:hypothetical protein